MPKRFRRSAFEGASVPISDSRGQIGLGDDAFDNADGLPVRGGAGIAGENGARRSRRAGAQRQQHAGRRREYAERDLGQPERRAVGRDDEVAGQRQLETAAETAAPDDGGGWRRDYRSFIE